MPRSNRWSVILAAGAGTRLERLTSDGRGAFVPKQFCSLNGGPSLLEETIARARGITSTERTLVVVAAEHRAHWRSVSVPPENIIVQPANRGTAIGILLGATAIIRRDASAMLTLLPSDHHVDHEHVLKQALEQTLAGLETCAASNAINFLGIQPELADPELGYIVYGGQRIGGGYRIEQFIEKPSRERAAELLQRSALWNSFILVARAQALVALIAERFPAVVSSFRFAWRASVRESAGQALDRLYECLPTIDFSGHVVEGAEAPLHVVPVPHCGWSDLGTPQRVASCLNRLNSHEQTPKPTESPHLVLAEAHLRRIETIRTSAGAAMVS